MTEENTVKRKQELLREMACLFTGPYTPEFPLHHTRADPNLVHPKSEDLPL